MAYPRAFSAGSNWLSDLGNTVVNVDGALYYKLGVMTSGAALVMWFTALYEWRTREPSPQQWFLLAASTLGSMGSLSLIMSAVYPINEFQQHAFWSRAFFMLMAMGLGFSVAALRYHPRFPRQILYLGSAAAILPLPLLVLGDVYALEWVCIGLIIAYVVSVGSSSRRMAGDALP